MALLHSHAGRQKEMVRRMQEWEAMVNEEIARIFERMARVLAFHGGNPFRIRAYERAADSVRELKRNLREMLPESYREIPGIGEDLSAMIREYVETGRIGRYEEERRGLSDEFIDLMEVPGLGPKTMAVLCERRGVRSLADLQRALSDPALAELPGFGERRVASLRRSLAVWLGGRERMPLGVALPLAEDLLQRIRAFGSPLVTQAELAGSLRRGRETIGDVDIVIASGACADALAKIARMPGAGRILSLGATRLSLLAGRGPQVDVRAVSPDSFGAALQYFTGSKEHNVHLRSLARERGLKINEYGVFRERGGDVRIGGRIEKEIYDALGFGAVPPPEIREDHGEIEAGLRARIPRLVALADIRGDLHVHSVYSDGRCTLPEIVERAQKLGYAYVAVSDHSQSARIARGLDARRLRAKLEEIGRLRERLASASPLLLAGAEVDILPDGQLDYPDEILAQLDVVIAGVHSGLQQSRSRMTDRLLAAAGNPRVHILAHPTARLLGSRAPLDFDFERVARRAAERQVALEVNGSPLRLDLNGTLIRAALGAGCLLCIGSDAHTVDQMSDIRYGVMQARRGWAPANRVINTWPAPRLIRWLHRERPGASGDRLAG